MKRIITVLLTCCCLFIGCNIKKEIEPIDTQVEYRDAGDFHLTLSHDGLQRSYILYVPPGLQVGDTAPVVLVLHGATGSSAKMMGDTNIAMNQKADDEKFLVVYPQGTGDAQLDTYYWNAVHCCASAYEYLVCEFSQLSSHICCIKTEREERPYLHVFFGDADHRYLFLK